MGINKLYGIMNDMKEKAGLEDPRITLYRYSTSLITSTSKTSDRSGTALGFLLSSYSHTVMYTCKTIFVINIIIHMCLQPTKYTL